MTVYKLELPDDFDDYAWEVGSKGWFSCAIAIFDEVRYKVTFYDPVRLAQDISDELAEYPVFMERNLVVIRFVDRCHMEKAIEAIAKSGQYVNMVKEGL